MLAHNPLPPGFGGLGDSFTDEYEFYKLRNTARNYVEQLDAADIAYYGPFSETARPDLRAQGFAFNWGLSGATSANLAQEVQGLLPQVESGQVQFVTILIGGNDFESGVVASHPRTVLSNLPPVVLSSIQTAVGQILAASPTVKIAVSTLEELEETPRLEGRVSSGQVGSGILRLADQEQDVVNAGLRRMANHNSRIVIADFESQLEVVSSEPFLTVGDVEVSTTTTGTDPHNLFLSDGEHIGTIEQGLFGNVFIDAINSKFGTHFADLTDAQILATAGLS